MRRIILILVQNSYFGAPSQTGRRDFPQWIVEFCDLVIFITGFRFRFCLLLNRFTTREVELEDAIRGQQGLGFTRMYTRMARVIDPTQVSPVPPSRAGL